MLMLTWSSLLAEVGIVSTLAGCASLFSSEVSAAAVTCAIMNPDCRPPSRVRNAGSSLSAGLTSRSVRRSLMVASCAMAMASRSAAMATGAPWKLPPETISPSAANTIGLSVAALASMATISRTKRIASRAEPCTCAAQRSE